MKKYITSEIKSKKRWHLFGPKQYYQSRHISFVFMPFMPITSMIKQLYLYVIQNPLIVHWKCDEQL